MIKNSPQQMIESLAVECSESFMPWFLIFSKTTAFFTKEKRKKFVGIIGEKLLYKHIEHDMDFDDNECVYLNCTFKEWFDMIFKLINCFHIAHLPEDAIKVIKRVLCSNLVGFSVNRKCQLFLVWHGVLLHANRSEEAFDALRQLTVQYPQLINGYHLFLYLLPHDPVGVKIISSSNMSRCIKRQLKRIDGGNNDINLFCHLLNAYSLLGSRSVQPALIYIMRTLQKWPNCIEAKLLAGINWIARGMNRSTTNRHQNVLVGVQYLVNYFEDEKNRHYVQGAYNMGRAFQQIGLNDLAVDFYLKALKSKSLNDILKKKKEITDIDKMAVFNLSLILKAKGTSYGHLLANKLLQAVIVI